MPLTSNSSLYIFPKKIIAYFEQQNAPLSNYILTFGFIVILRNFFECFSHYTVLSLFNSKPHFLLLELIHFSLFYLLIAVMLCILLYYASGTTLKNIVKTLLPCFLIIWLEPILDLIFSRGVGHHIYYLIPNQQHHLWYYYLTFFGDYSGFSFGMRVEIILAIFFTYYYLRIKSASVVKSVICSIITYSIIFFAGASPYVVAFFSPGPMIAFNVDAATMITYYLIILFPFGIWLAYLSAPRSFRAIYQDIRGLRLLHYELMPLLGAAFAIKNITYAVLPQYILLAITIVFYWLGAVMSNNIADQTIDSISNPNRPLISNTIQPTTYNNIFLTIFILSLLYALAINIFTLLMICLLSCIHIFYSFPPLRYKRIPIISKALIAASSCGLMLIGYYVMTHSLGNFPFTFSVIMLFTFTLAANFIDIKDLAGDKADSIYTLPVLFGAKWSKIIIGIFFIIAYLGFYLFFQSIAYLLIALIFGSISFYLINKRNYQEWKLLGTYLIAIIGIIIYVGYRNI